MEEILLLIAAFVNTAAAGINLRTAIISVRNRKNPSPAMEKDS